MTSKKYLARREQKARKILAILQDFLGDLSHLCCLDIGCHQGNISVRLSEAFGSVVGVDLDVPKIHQAWLGKRRANLHFVHADGSQLAFPNGHFDVVICAQVYEHMQAQQALASEVWRVLRPGGVCFFSGPNRWTLIEEHYRLPFLSWLPRPLADRCLQVFRGRPRYDVWPLSYWQLRSLWRDFWVHDYTVPMLKSPERFGLTISFLRWFRHLPAAFLRLLLPLIPNYNWILVKR